MRKEVLIERVKTKMREVTPFDEGIQVLSPEVEAIDNYIEDQLQPSCDEILLACPLSLTNPVQFPGPFTKTVSMGKSIGYQILPADFLRINTIMASSWERPVHRAISTDNPDYQLQFNKHARGGNAKPVVVKNSTRLELYTMDNEATLTTGTYVKKIDLENIQINANLIEPLITLIAANVYGIYGNPMQKSMLAEYELKMKVLYGN